MTRRIATRRGRAAEGGFTMIEVLIALMILIIGIAGLLSMQLSAMRATSYSRHATEASMLCEDKMEDLRTIATISLVSGTDQVDARGVVDAAGLYTRNWTVDSATGETILTVVVSWEEQGGIPETMTMTTIRSAQ